ncbi:SMI1/KNR4 family protein [Actinoplanes hulinensis]|uniref:SMI1/KNR4 family protein n=1 Tax=Actinoplanes hulinensis TaxID=1144547 RepID=UPI0027E27ACF|nr:SMI1/KNR4 family protein [Actinoplanes hulinensis]
MFAAHVGGSRAVPEIDWSDVRPRLAVLAGKGATLGSGELAPPLTAAELAEVESQFGVDLPGEYRGFLLEAGRGGAGPGYGLFPLRRVDGRWELDSDGGPSHDRESLIRPFGHIRGFNPLDGLLDGPAIDRDEELWWAMHDRLAYNPAHRHGLLFLCHLGCALWVVLVVSGPSRGQIWTDYTTDGEGFQPEQNPDGSPMNFADWYRTWLTNAEFLASYP